MYYFTSTTPSGTYILYMGKDKYENEELIKYALPTDVWFHVSDLSSAHIYLRLYDDATLETLKSLPSEVLNDCAQLTKSNSIEGSKKGIGRLKIIYTPASNLLKSKDMEIGQVSFKSMKLCLFTHIDEKDSSILNRLNKTQIEKPIEFLKKEREEYNQKKRMEEKQRKKEAVELQKKQKEEYKKEKEAKSYDLLMSEENMTSNAEVRMSGQTEEDFM